MFANSSIFSRKPLIFHLKVLCASIVYHCILGVNNVSKHPDLYDGIPRKFLEWKRRKRLICEEIHRYDASILCFQEVDRFDDLTISLQKDGFRGVLTGRTGKAVDGCATFWKEDQFTLVHQESIEFKTFGLRDNAQLCILKVTCGLIFLQQGYVASLLF